MVLVVKTLPANAGDIRDADLIPGSGRCPGGGHGTPWGKRGHTDPYCSGPWEPGKDFKAQMLKLFMGTKYECFYSSPFSF